MNAPEKLMPQQAARIEITLDGRRVNASEGETLLSVAR